LDGLRDLPFNPGDIFAAFSIRGHQLKPGEPVPPDESAGFATDHFEIFERPAPTHADDQGEHLRTHGERLENVDGLVVTKEPLGQDSDIVQKPRRDDDVEMFHGFTWLTGKPLA
jgi:hypothetical protein